MTSRTAVERRFFAQHPGAVFDEAWHKAGLPAGRDAILRFERALGLLPQFECALTHFFVDGLYVRQIFIPAGVAIVGYIHMQDCVSTVSQGAILINDGETAKMIEAPSTFTVPKGSKKAGYALKDTIWCDCYVNADNERDIPTLEERLTADTHEQFLLRTGQIPRLVDTR